ncbi:hypothetical protein [Kibdelosporangium philippinense]
MIDTKADLRVELLGTVDIGHRDRDQLELEVHRNHSFVLGVAPA